MHRLLFEFGFEASAPRPPVPLRRWEASDFQRNALFSNFAAFKRFQWQRLFILLESDIKMVLIHGPCALFQTVLS